MKFYLRNSETSINRINYTNKIENKDRGQYNHGAHKLWTFHQMKIIIK